MLQLFGLSQSTILKPGVGVGIDGDHLGEERKASDGEGSLEGD